MKYKIVCINTFVCLMTLLLVLSNCSGKKSIIQDSSFMQTSLNLPNTDDSVEPNMIFAKVEIIEVYKEPQEICGVKKTKVCKIEVIEVLKQGVGLQRGIDRGQKYKVSFTQLDSKTKSGDSLLIKIRELPCFETHEVSSFLVVKYD